MLRTLTCVLLLSAIASSLPSQDNLIHGRVRAADGKAIVGAKVHLIARVHPYAVTLPVLDQIETKTGEDGRFKVELKPGIEYGAHAIVAREDGSYAWASMRGTVQVGERPVLRLGATDVSPIRVRVVGREAWKHEEPLTFVAVVTRSSGAPWVSRPFDPTAERILPQLPGDAVQLQIRGKSGILLTTARLLTGKAARREAWKRTEEMTEEQKSSARSVLVRKDLLEIRMCTPVRMLVKAVFEKKAKPGLLGGLLGNKKKEQIPISGARIWIHDKSNRLLGGTTDDMGMAIVSLPEQWSGTQPVLVEADGYAEAAVSLRRDRVDPARDLDALRRKGKADAVIPLLEGKGAKTRIVVRNGRPAKKLAVLLSSGVSLGPQSSMNYGQPWLFHTDDDGVLVLPGRVAGKPCRLDVVLDPDTRAVLTSEDGPAPHPLVTLYHGSELSKGLGEQIDLSALRTLDIRVKNPPGQERMPAEILLGSIRDRMLVDAHVRSMMADPRGRLRLLLPAGGDWAIGACSMAGIRLGVLRLGEGEQPAKHAIEMIGALFIEGTVRTSGEDPLTGTRVGCRIRSTQRPEFGLLDGVRRYREVLQPVCDDKGRFRLAVPEPDFKYRLTFAVPQAGGGSIHMSSWDREVEVGKESRKGVEVTIDPPSRR